jgi:hypothetical protein
MDYLEDAKQDVVGWREYHEARCPYDLEKLMAEKEERGRQLEKLFGQQQPVSPTAVSQ